MQTKAHNPKKSITEIVMQKCENEEILPNEGSILLKWLKNKVNSGEATKKVNLFNLLAITKFAHEMNDNVASMQNDTIMYCVNRVNEEYPKQNTRQKYLAQFKTFLKFRHNFGVKIEGYDYIMSQIKPGSYDWRAIKYHDLITIEDFRKIIQTVPLNLEEKTILIMMWDGYLRPGSIYQLKWCDMHPNNEGTRTYIDTFKTGIPREIEISQNTYQYLEMLREERAVTWNSIEPIFPTNEGTSFKGNGKTTELFKRIKEQTGIKQLKPKIIRNSAITHDLSHKSVQYICMKAFGTPFNPLINNYAKPEPGKLAAQGVFEDITVVPNVIKSESQMLLERIEQLEKHRDERERILLAKIEELSRSR